MSNKLFSKKKITIVLFILLFGLLSLFIKAVITKQDSRQQASTSTSLYFTPDSSTSNPIMKKVNESFTLNLMVEPGTAMVSFVSFTVLFDQSKISVIDTNSVTINTSAFPALYEGPFVNPGRIDATVSTGNDPTRAVTEPTKVASITFKAISGTGNQAAEISFKDTSIVLSVGASESASQNVLELTIPAFIKIEGDNNNPTTAPTNTPMPPITPTPPNTALNLTIYMHGIGSSGDNPNPTNSSLSNKNPLRKNRPVVLELFNSKNLPVATRSSTLIYASSSGNFKGYVDMGTNIPLGDYTIKVKSDQYLRNAFPGIQKIPPQSPIQMPDITLITGDVLNDNKLNILDYNILYGCYKTDLFPIPRSCTSNQNISADLTDEGSVNMYDINLFIRELSVQSGL